MTQHTSRLAPTLALGITVILWASAFTVVRAVGDSFSPGAIALGRQLSGTAALTVWALVRSLRTRRPPSVPRGRPLFGVVGWGVLWFGAYNLVFNSAEQRLDAGTTSFLVNLAPALVAIGAGVLLREGFPPRLLVGVALALAGVGLIATTATTGHSDPLGILFGLSAAVLYAAGALWQKRLLPHVDALTMTWLGSAVGAAACLPFAPELIDGLTAAPREDALALLYLGVFPTAIAFTTWGYALSRLSAGRTASATYLVPPVVLTLSWIVLGEAPAPVAVAGGAVALAGVAVATWPRRARSAARPTATSRVQKTDATGAAASPAEARD